MTKTWAEVEADGAHEPGKSEKMIYGKILAIQKAIGVIPKDKKNTQRGYKYREIDAIVAKLHGLFIEHGVFVTHETVGEPIVHHGTRVTTDKTTGESREQKWIEIIGVVRFTAYAEDGSSVSMAPTGQAIAYDQFAAKQMMTDAEKTAFTKLFSIPVMEDKYHNPLDENGNGNGQPSRAQALLGAENGQKEPADKVFAAAKALAQGINYNLQESEYRTLKPLIRDLSGAKVGASPEQVAAHWLQTKALMRVDVDADGAPVLTIKEKQGAA